MFLLILPWISFQKLEFLELMELRWFFAYVTRDFISKNGIFGIHGITIVFVFYLRPLSSAAISQTPIQSFNATITKNHRNSINSLWNKISSAHHNSLRAMEFLESLDLPSLSFTLTIEGDRERPPPSHPYLDDRRRQKRPPSGWVVISLLVSFYR